MVAQKWAIVTGANRGLGYEVCKKLVEAGRPVILTTRDKDNGSKAAKQLLEDYPKAKVEVLPLDTSDSASIAAFAATIGEQYSGQVDLLVNNAGIAIWGKFDAGPHELTTLTNVDGPIDLTLALLPHMAPGGRVVMVSSALGALGCLTPDYAEPISSAATLGEVKAAAHRFDPDSPLAKASFAPSYCVSKAALNRSVQLLAAGDLLKDKGVSVVAVCPGWCRTDMGSGAEVEGHSPPRTAEQGAASILMAASPGVAENGSFTFDGEARDWVTAPSFG